MAKPKVCLLIIDGQNDFINRDGRGSLGVTGAVADMDRLSAMINKNRRDIDDIQLTFDSHNHICISHSCWWVDKKGNHPSPFTLITEDDVITGKYRAYNAAFQEWSLKYVKSLKANNRYVLCIWPDHCLIGSLGQALDPVLFRAVLDWETESFAIAPKLVKGSNPFTEHYSICKADVEFPGDPKTRTNTDFIDTLKKYDIILTSGEALSHCLANSISDIAENFGPDEVKKIFLIQDATSSVTGFEKQGEDFVNRMVALGMNLTTTDTFFK